MVFDEEELDPHGECAARIHELEAQLAERTRERDGLAAMNLQRVAAYEEIMRVNNRWQERAEAAEREVAALREALQSARDFITDERPLAWEEGATIAEIDAALAPRPPVKEE
jgi:hypothetical protein